MLLLEWSWRKLSLLTEHFHLPGGVVRSARGTRRASGRLVQRGSRQTKRNRFFTQMRCSRPFYKAGAPGREMGMAVSSGSRGDGRRDGRPAPSPAADSGAVGSPRLLRACAGRGVRMKRGDDESQTFAPFLRWADPAK